MENEKVKIEIKSTKDGEVLIGNHFHKKIDHTRQSMETSDIESFLKFVDQLDGEESERRIYFDHSGIDVYDKEINRYSIPRATCKTETDPHLLLLIDSCNNSQSRGQMELLLRRLIKFAKGSNAFDLLDSLKDFKVRKITKVDRRKEANGNFVHSISRESAGNEDFIPPSTISFEVPIFEDLEDTEVFEFEIEFDFRESGGEFVFEFTLVNLNFITQLNRARKKILVKKLSKIKTPNFWGDITITTQDDEDEYIKNDLTISNS